jgi:NAD(P)-dependent dehydrogenase (short-subunit alcohol dehydrogenase family)
MSWSWNSIADLKGKTFVVTGGNSGIGFATAEALAAKRARVIIGSRSEERAAKAIATIRSQHAGADIAALPLDLASLASVHAFASRLAVESSRVDVLINNAGVMMTPPARTEDGFELQFGTNMLGHFALTGLLLPLLGQSPASRVVTVTSLGHWFGRIDFDNLNGEKRYQPMLIYAQSKLANLVFAYELQRRFECAGSQAISVGVHPGVTHSDLGRHAGWAGRVLRLYGQSIQQGALPSLMAAVEPQIRGRDFIGPGGFMTFKGPPIKQSSSRQSHNTGIGSNLWARAQEMTGVRYL